MPRDKCPACGGSDLYHSKLSANGGVIVSRTRNKLAWNWVIAKCATCLSCGTISPYIDEPGLEKLRGWKLADGDFAAATPTPDDSTGIDPRTVAIIAAILGALATFGIYMMGVIDKMK